MNETLALIASRLPFLAALTRQPSAATPDDSNLPAGLMNNIGPGPGDSYSPPSPPTPVGPGSPDPYDMQSAAALQSKGDLLMQILQSGLQSSNPNAAQAYSAQIPFAGGMQGSEDPAGAGPPLQSGQNGPGPGIPASAQGQPGSPTPGDPGTSGQNVPSRIPKPSADDDDVPPPDISDLLPPGDPNMPKFWIQKPTVPLLQKDPEKSDACSAKIEEVLNRQLSDAYGRPIQVQSLGPTDVSGSTGKIDPARPGWRDGAYNYNFFVADADDPQAKNAQFDDPQKGSTFGTGRWDNGLHVPDEDGKDPVIGYKGIPKQDEVTRANNKNLPNTEANPRFGRGTYKGKSGFYFTAHFDTGSPFHRWMLVNPIGLGKHLGGDVAFKLDHGC